MLQEATGLGMLLQASAVPQKRMGVPRRPCGRRPWGPQSKAGFISIETLNSSQLFFSFRSSFNRCYQFGHKSMDFSSMSSALIHLMKDNVYREERTETRKGAGLAAKRMLAPPRAGKTIISQTFRHQVWEGNQNLRCRASSSARTAREVKRQKRPSKEPKRKECDCFLLGSHHEAQYCMEFHWLNDDWKAVCSLGMVERTHIYMESEQRVRFSDTSI